MHGFEDTMTEQISQETYEQKFGISDSDHRREKALDHALDIRKFEIQLYWTRAAYFWTFIAAALAAYGAIQALDNGPNKSDLSVIVGCVGFVFSFAWYCVNRGSKQWQENWENHVDLLEDTVTGPLYKVVLKRPNPTGFWGHVERFLTGPAPFSVSKINQIVSLYISAVWVLLVWYALPAYNGVASIPRMYLGVILLSAVSSGLVAWRGRTFVGEYRHIATLRETTIASAASDQPEATHES